MRHLLALLASGTHGTQAEPDVAPTWVPKNNEPCQHLTRIGTCGTLGTPKTNRAAASDDLAQRVAELIDAYHERLAIVLEAGDIGAAEARRTALEEVGRRFVEAFIPDESATC